MMENRKNRIDDFDIIVIEVFDQLEEILNVASSLESGNTAVLLAAFAGNIREKTASLALIFHELVGGETNDD